MSKSSLIKRLGVVGTVVGALVVAPAFAGLGSSIANAHGCVVLAGTNSHAHFGLNKSGDGATCNAGDDTGSDAAVTICADTDFTDDDAAPDSESRVDVGGQGLVFVDGLADPLHHQGVFVRNGNGERVVEAWDSNFPISYDGNLFLLNLLGLTGSPGPQGSATVLGTGISSSVANC